MVQARASSLSSSLQSLVTKLYYHKYLTILHSIHSVQNRLCDSVISLKTNKIRKLNRERELKSPVNKCHKYNTRQNNDRKKDKTKNERYNTLNFLRKFIRLCCLEISHVLNRHLSFTKQQPRHINMFRITRAKAHSLCLKTYLLCMRLNKQILRYICF